MKQKLLKNSLLLFLSGIIIVSCTLEKDALEEHEHKELTKQRISLYEIPGLQNKINTKIQANRSMNRGEEIDYLTLINPDNVLLIEEENGNKHYTFSLNMQESNTLTNVIIKQVGTEIDYKVIEYTSPDIEQWLIDNIDNGYSNIEPTITEKGGNPNSSAFCPRFHYSCPGVGHTFSDIAGGENCPYEFSDFIVTITYEACGGAGGGAGNFDHFGDDNSNNNTGSPSGNNYGSGGNNNNTTYTNPNPPCDPRVNCPVFDDSSIKDPCIVLTQAKENETVQNNIDFLKTKTTGKLEFAYEIERQNNAGTPSYSSIYRAGTNYGVNVQVGGHTQGQAHNHPINGLSIPSWDDIYWTQRCEEDNTYFNNGTAFNIIVAANPANVSQNILYAITINDFSTLQQATNAVFNIPEILNEPDPEEKTKKIMQLFNEKFNNTPNNSVALELKYLEIFANYGINLHKFNDSTNKWEKLTVDPTNPNNVTKQPCN